MPHRIVGLADRYVRNQRWRKAVCKFERQHDGGNPRQLSDEAALGASPAGEEKNHQNDNVVPNHIACSTQNPRTRNRGSIGGLRQLRKGKICMFDLWSFESAAGILANGRKIMPPEFLPNTISRLFGNPPTCSFNTGRPPACRRSFRRRSGGRALRPGKTVWRSSGKTAGAFLAGTSRRFQMGACRSV